METVEKTFDKIKAGMEEARRDWKHARRQLRLAKLEETFFRARCLAMNDCLMAFEFADLAAADVPVYTGNEDRLSVYGKLQEIGRRENEPAVRAANLTLGYHIWNNLAPFEIGLYSCGHCSATVVSPEYTWGCPGAVPPAARIRNSHVIPADDSTPRRESAGNMEINDGDKAPEENPRGHDWHWLSGVSGNGWQCSVCKETRATATTAQMAAPCPGPSAPAPPAAVNACGHTWREAHEGDLAIHLCMLCGARKPRQADDLILESPLAAAESALHVWQPLITQGERGQYKCCRCDCETVTTDGYAPPAAGCKAPYV